MKESIIISASVDSFEKAKGLLDKLEVLKETYIVEVSLKVCQPRPPYKVVCTPLKR